MSGVANAGAVLTRWSSRFQAKALALVFHKLAKLQVVAGAVEREAKTRNGKLQEMKHREKGEEAKD